MTIKYAKALSSVRNMLKQYPFISNHPMLCSVKYIKMIFMWIKQLRMNFWDILSVK